MTGAEKVQKDSAGLKVLFGWLFGLGAFLVFSEITYMPLKAAILSIGSQEIGEASGGLAEAVVSAAPALALLAAIWQARSVFRNFSEGRILSTGSGRALSRVGDWLVVSTVLWVFVGPALGRESAAFGPYLSFGLMLGAIGLAIRLVGRVIEMAAAIKSDHDQIV